MSQFLHPQREVTRLDERSLALRRAIVDVLACADRGHIGSAFSLVEILRVLYDDIMHYDPANPAWPGRDRFILSKGHGCLALYVLLAEKGFFSSDELTKFCKNDGILGGHPEYGKVPGIEASTGSLGHGLPIGVGFAINALYEKSGCRTYVVVGDGECNEGSVWEGALSAAKHKLSNLCLIIDYNKQQSYGRTAEILDLEPLADKLTAFGFSVQEVDGHSVPALRKAFLKVPLDPGRPNAIICHTVKGKGVGHVEGNLEWHHKNKVSKEEIQALLAELGGN